jgi:5-methylcytosine-specific restriction endonuclease McrA
MTRLPKPARVRVDGDAHQQLRLRVLQRDGWRCQTCGAMANLEVHHLQFRSRQGENCEENLITLCSPCHKLAHS